MASEQDLVRELLSEIVKSKPDIKSSDHKWLIGMLKDLFNPKREFQHSDCLKEINGLANCLFWGIVDEIRHNDSHTIDQFETKNILRKLVKDYGQQEDLSRWCIESWCKVYDKNIDLQTIDRITPPVVISTPTPSVDTSSSFSLQLFKEYVQDTLYNGYLDINTRIELVSKGKQLGIAENLVKNIIETTCILIKDRSIKWIDEGGWWMYGHDLQHTRRSPFIGPKINFLKWSCIIGPVYYSSPAIGPDGTIFIGTKDFYLYSVKPNGKIKWAFKTGNDVWASPAIGPDGTIYVGSYDKKLYAINQNGTLKWEFETNGLIESSPAIGADGTIYFGCGDSKLYAINPDGTLKWWFKTNGGVDSSPAIDHNGTIYFGSHDGDLYAINQYGSKLWSYHTGFSIRSSPCISVDGTIYIGSNKLYAINPNGSLKWTHNTGQITISSPALGADGTIYTGYSKLYAINPDGSLKWTFRPGNCVFSSPAVDALGTILVGSDDHNLYAIEPDGSLRWAFKTGYWILSSPVIGSDGTVYIGSQDSKLYAIGNKDK